MRDPYEILGVQKTDSDAAIRAAYRKLAKKHHPDVNPGKPEAACTSTHTDEPATPTRVAERTMASMATSS